MIRRLIVLLVVVLAGWDQGYAQAGCPSTLQELVNATPAGGVLSVPPCIFRETVNLTKPILLEGNGIAEIRGSDVWTDWSKVGTFWISARVVPPLPLGSDLFAACTPNTANRCFLGEQIFIDGAPLKELVPGMTPTGGFFSLVSVSDRRVQLANDPTNHLVEVTTRERWINSNSDGLTITGIKFEHAGTAYNRLSAIGNDNHSNWTLSSSTLLYSHAQAVGISIGNNVKVLWSDLAYNGQAAIGGTNATNPLILGNHLHDNNVDGLFNGGWDAAGLKMTGSQGLQLLDNEFDYNNGQGLWIDIHDIGDEIARNKIHDNNGFGLMYEISSGAFIYDNAIWSNTQSGMFLSSDTGLDVAHNTSAWNRLDGMRVEINPRSDNPPGVGTNILLHDNAVFQITNTRGAESWVDNTGTKALYAPVSNNQGLRNRYWFPVPENTLRRFYWGAIFTGLSGYTVTPASMGSTYLSNSDARNLLESFGMPNLAVPTV